VQTAPRFVLWLDDLQKLAVSDEFVRRRGSIDGKVPFAQWSDYRLLALSQMLLRAADANPALRVVFSGTSDLERNKLVLDSAWKTLSLSPARSDTVFVRELLAKVLALDHIPAAAQDRTCAQLAGCKRSVQFFLEAITVPIFQGSTALTAYFCLAVVQARCFGVPAKEVTADDWAVGVEAARASFFSMMKGNLKVAVPGLSLRRTTTEALLALVFFSSFGGRLVLSSAGPALKFSSDKIPVMWHNMARAGLLDLSASHSAGGDYTLFRLLRASLCIFFVVA
jgi:hypothetical protein